MKKFLNPIILSICMIFALSACTFDSSVNTTGTTESTDSIKVPKTVLT